MSSNFSFPRKKFSYNNAKLYKSLGSLIREYRQWRGISQEAFAESIRISVRELQNWEANSRRVRIENLHDLSEFAGIPMQVLVALNADQPIWYSLRKRFFMYSLIEKAQCSSYELFDSNENREDQTILETVPITTEKQINMILSCHSDLYGTKRSLRKDVIKAAIKIIPDLNIIINDYWGHYVGHRITLPFKMDIYQALKTQKTIEDYLTGEMISDIIALGEGVFLVYSTFVANIITSSLLSNATQTLSKQIKRKDRYVFVTHTVTRESEIILKNLGMTFVRDYAHLGDEVCPVLYETKLDYQLRPDGPLGWMIKSGAEKALTNNKIIKGRQKQSPAIPCTKLSDLVSPFKIYFPEEMAQPDALTVDKNADALTADTFSSDRGKRNYQKRLGAQIPKFKITNEVCPNTKCTLYAKLDKTNIISNGTFRTKDGTALRRFICKECGKSFCNTTPIIFHGLRSPDEKILNALRLLVKGMSLRGVAEIIGVDPRSVRSWLKVTAEQNEKIKAMLIKELKVSPIELEALCAFAKSNSLRKRALLCRAKNKSYTTE
ncbi:MAG: helix-turn-helix domain-containing protein [Proteobacteria bacterium]|nr:helix-turn-helix domain-containing protein [Pseudomonadota bacterium]